MRLPRCRTLLVATALMLAASGTGAPALATEPAGGATPGEPAQCAVPSNGADPAQSSPAEHALDPTAVRDAIAYASTHLRTSVQIFRNNCRVAAGPLDPVTDHVPYDVWSSTKSVISILTGIAADQHKLDVDDPIGTYLPSGPGWGDPAHRQITIRDLLTETAGTSEAILSEAATTATDANVAHEALAQPLTHEPGTHFEYAQRVPDLLAYVVQRAVGEDLQDFAQRNLFDPIGIDRSSYFWLRDRSGNTYGYAHLFIPPAEFAKLGLLMQNDGNWNGRRVLSKDYIHRLRQPTDTNGCYGFLFWVNSGSPCTGANIPAAQTFDRNAIPSAPPDLYGMVGAFHQNNFIIPSLNMTVTWTGLFGDTDLNLSGLLSAAPTDLYYNFFRILLRGVQDQDVPDPGPYPSPPLNLDINPLNYADPRVLGRDLAPNPHCNVLVCAGTVPIRGLAENGEAVLRTVLGAGS